MCIAQIPISSLIMTEMKTLNVLNLTTLTYVYINQENKGFFQFEIIIK